jgi:hypothetical protein
VARLLTDRYHDRLAGVLSCYDRIVITGTLPGACFAEGMTRILRARGIRVFDYPTQFAAPLRDRVREAAARLAAAAGITIEDIAKSYIRKEDVVAKVLAARGPQPGLVHMISAMEACDSCGMTNRRTGTFCARTVANASIIISTLWMPSLAWFICGCRRGARFACSSTATATAGWRAS